MGWSNAMVYSVAIICVAIVLVYIIKALDKCILQKQNFKQNKELEKIKQENSLALLKERKPDQKQLEEINNRISALDKKIAQSADQTKQDLIVANSRIEVYKELIQLLKSSKCTN